MSKDPRGMSPFGSDYTVDLTRKATEDEKRKAAAYVERHTSGAQLAELLRMLGLEEER